MAAEYRVHDEDVGPGPELAPISRRSAAAAAAEDLGGWDAQSTRTPERIRERLIGMFRAERNIEYLRKVFAAAVPPGPLRKFALDTLEDSVYSFEKIEDVIYSDPIAQRGDLRPAASLWGELRRINRAFFEYRMSFIQDKAALLSGRTDDGQWDDDEDYLTRMFTADSLRPPGLEHLNSTGPLFGIREDQTKDGRPAHKWPPGARYAAAPGAASSAAPARGNSSAAAAPARFVFHETFSTRPPAVPAPRHPTPRALAPRAAGARGDSPRPREATPQFMSARERAARGLEQARVSTSESRLVAADPAVDPDDLGWDSGNPNRTPEQAVAEYWGEDHVESSTLGATEAGGETNNERYGEGPLWRENGGTRFMRYPEIPFWQNLSRGREYDRDIDETLGTGSREEASHVRRWDLSRMRNPRGEEYRTYGARNDSSV